MLTRYKVEIFSRDFTFKSFSPISSPDIYFDYLTLEKTSIDVVGIAAEKGDYAHITDDKGNVIYQGIIDEITISGRLKTLSLKPLLSIFDTEVYFDRTTANANIEGFLSDLITANYINSGDDLQNITGLSVSTTSTTEGVLNLKDNVHNLFDLMSTAFSAYGIVVDLQFNPGAQTTSCSIGKVLSTATVEAHLQGVISKNIVLGDSYGQLNKIVIVNKADETETATYYLYNDGSIGTENTDRITPVFFKVSYLDSTSEDIAFSEAAYQKAYEALSPQKYDNLIELGVPNNSKIVDVNMAIGTEVTVINNNDVYTSILTGFEHTDEMTMLTFGAVRIDLTKKLFIERRQKS